MQQTPIGPWLCAGLEPQGGFASPQHPHRAPQHQGKGGFLLVPLHFSKGEQSKVVLDGEEKPLTNLVTFPFSV